MVSGAEYQKEVRVVLQEYGVLANCGLSEEQVRSQTKIHGRNIIATASKLSWFSSLIRQCKNFVLYILLAAAIVSLIKGHVLEVYVIIAIVLFIVGLGFFMEYRAYKDMEALRKLTPLNVKVVRYTKNMDVPSEDLVPGDIIKLSRGDVVPADCRLIEAVHFHVNESMLTGESVEVTKSHEAIHREVSISDQKNMVFAGTHIANGHALAIVVATGKKTQMGSIATMLSNVKEQDSPLQKRVDKLGKHITYVVLIACCLIFLITLLRGSSWDAALLLAVAVAVSGVPESLPAVIGIALAQGIKRMVSKNAIVKQLTAVETLGTCTVICTDKTGTLTRNEMVAELIYTASAEMTVTGKGIVPYGEILHGGKRAHVSEHSDLKKLMEICSCCNNASVEQQGTSWKLTGEATEGAITVLALKSKIAVAAKREHELAFDPVRKCMSTIDVIGRQRFVHLKGAPEIILSKSTHFLKNGKPLIMTRKLKDQILQKNHEYATRGLRILALAYKAYTKKSYTPHDVESKLVFVGLVAIRDPPADGVKESIVTCKDAGINVVMITGDNPVTALAIASELGIYKDGQKMLTGQELDNISDQDLQLIINSVTVYARTTPAHKLRIVTLLQKQNNIVAMTGDGVNDAPALKQANIGVAMGKRGTEVAKEAAKMVIADDNFTTIVNAVKEGRIIYTNIRKFVYYLLAIGFSEIMLIGLCVVLGIFSPLTPLMILFINLVTSDILALAIIREGASPWIMRQKPRDPKESLLDNYLLLRITQVVPVITLGTISLFLWELWTTNDLIYAQTVAFATLIIFELFQAFNARSFVRSNFGHEIGGNKVLIFALLFAVGTMMVAIYWPPAQGVFGTVPLKIEEWLKILCLTPIVLLFVEGQKAIVKSEFKERERAVQSRE